MGHRLTRRPTCRSPRSWRRSRRSCSARAPRCRQIVPPGRCEQLEPLTREAVADGERIGVGEYVQAVAAARRGTAAVLEAMPRSSWSSRPCSPARRAAGRVPASSRPPRALAGLVRVALLHRALQRDRPARALGALRHDRRRPAGRPADRRATGRRRARALARRRPRAGAGLSGGGRRRPRRRRGRRADRGAASSRPPSSTQRVPRAHPRARRRRTATRATPARSTPGCASTRRTRSAAAARADARAGATRGPRRRCAGIPIGLKDLYAVAGKPLTASSRLLDERPDRDCDVWARLRAHGHGPARPPAHARVRGRRHDRPGRQPLGARALGRRLERRLGGGAGRAHGAGRDRDRHRRLAAHPVGAAAARRRSSRRAGSSRCAASSRSRTSLDHAGPDGAHARGLRAAARRRWPGPTGPAASALPAARRAAGAARAAPLAGVRLALSPRIAARRRSTPTSPTASTPRSRAAARWAPTSSSRRRRRRRRSTSATTSSTSSTPSCSLYHRRFDGRRELYRPSLREWVEQAERAAVSAEALRRGAGSGAASRPRHGRTGSRAAGRRASLEPTVPVVAPLRGDGYDGRQRLRADLADASGTGRASRSRAAGRRRARAAASRSACR